jgi:hypothetical protein
MRAGIVLLLVIAFAITGCTTKYMLAPEDKALLENAINAAKDAKASADSADSSANKASREAGRAEGAADRAESAADRAESAATKEIIILK